jgi:ribosomal protein S18 acetylase RimI-like enzyme
MKRRYEYCLSLSLNHELDGELSAADRPLRKLTQKDTAILAGLMLDAYRDTIDYEGETLDQATDEIKRYFEGAYGPPLHDCSWLYLREGMLGAACLVSWWEKRKAPLVAFVMTRAQWKRTGLGGLVLRETLRSLIEREYPKVRAVITEGNTPSEGLFNRFGFLRMTEVG